MIENVNRSTVLFAAFIVLIYMGYFISTVLLANQNKRALLQALETSYSLTNSLQASVEMDSLTRVYSRATTAEKISDVIASAGQEIHALALLDVDNFKGINDTYGHQTGDLYLQDFTRAVKAALRVGDIVGRLGGDEFVVLLRNIEQASNAETLMKEVIDNVNNITIAGVALCDVSVSVGVVMVPSATVAYEDLLHKADMALYQAKKGGKNCCEIFKQ